MRYDVAVIGGGLAGLSSAAALAAAGKKVVVLEQFSTVGGSTHVFRRKDQWEWEVGVHHVGDCGPDGDMPTAFRGLGLGEHITFQEMERTGYEKYVLPDLEFTAPADWDEFISRFVALFPDERRKLHRFFATVRKVGAAIDRVDSTMSFAGTSKTATKLGLHAPFGLISATAVMKLYGLSERAQLLISASPCGSLNCPPDRFPFSALAAFLQRFVGGGAWFPRGGAQVFTANLARVIQHYDGEIVTGAYAEQILVDGGRVRGVAVRGGESYLANTVVCTADIKKTYQHLIPAEALKPAHAKRVSQYRMATPFFNAFLGADVDLTALYPNRDHFSLPTWTGYDDVESRLTWRDGDTAESWIDRVRPIVPAFVHCTDMKDASRSYSPPGCSSLEVMFPLPMDYRMWGAGPVDSRDGGYTRDNDTYSTIKEFLIEMMIERATDVFPELSGRVVHREAATALTQERFTQSTEGSSYGIEWNVRQNAILRPGPKTHIGGLFLAGASCPPGPGTEGVLLSGVMTAGSILRRNLMQEFRSDQFLVPDGTIPPVPDDWDSLAEATPSHRSRGDHESAHTSG